MGSRIVLCAPKYTHSGDESERWKQGKQQPAKEDLAEEVAKDVAH